MGSGDDGGGVEVAGAGGGRTDADRLVGGLDVEAGPIGVAVDGDGGDTEPPGSADDAAGDLAAVGDQDLLDGDRRRRRG